MAAKEMISLRVWRSDLEAWKQAAKAEGVTRSAWINQTLNRATQKSTSGGSASAATEPASSKDSARTIHPEDSVSIVEAGEQSKSSQ